MDHLLQNTGMLNDFYLNFDRILLSEDSLWFGGRSREEIYREAVQKALAGGPSDRRFSRWYCLDLDNWISGKYKRIDTGSDQVRLAF